MDSFSNGLAAGTLVTTSDGDKKIEEIKAGDLVLSGVGEGQTSFFRVEKVSAKPYGGPMLRIESNSGSQLRATPNHICFGKLRPDKTFESLQTNKMACNSIFLVAFDKKKPSSRSHYVGRESNPLEVEYFEDVDRAEAAARRMSQIDGGAEIDRIAAFIPWEHFSFMAAADLQVATPIPIVKDEVIQSATITNITEEQYDGLVYDLDIPEARNFAANGVLVHDSTS